MSKIQIHLSDRSTVVFDEPGLRVAVENDGSLVIYTKDPASRTGEVWRLVRAQFREDMWNWYEKEESSDAAN